MHMEDRIGFIRALLQSFASKNSKTMQNLAVYDKPDLAEAYRKDATTERPYAPACGSAVAPSGSLNRTAVTPGTVSWPPESTATLHGGTAKSTSSIRRWIIAARPR